MPVPPSPVLRAASRWLEHLSTSNVARIRALFTSHPKFADVTPTQYAAAYTWLENCGLLDKTISPGEGDSTIFEAAIAEALWFADADLLVTDANSLPEDAIRAAETLNVTASEAFTLTRLAWGKVDAEQRSRLGTAGEVGLIKLLESVESLTIRHVAAESDGFGYDISVSARGFDMHIEVKSTTRRGRLRIYLSRHEFDTMRHDRSWALVAVRLNEELEPVSLATVSRDWLIDTAPIDRHPGSRWESVRLEVPQEAIEHGVSRLNRLVRCPKLAILAGFPTWPG